MDGELAALWEWAGSSALSPTQAALWMALDATPLTRRRHEGDLSELRRLQALESARAASAANLRVEEFWAGLGVSHDHLHSRTPHEVVRHREGVTPLMVTPDHGDVAVLDWLKAIHNLGALLERQGKLDEAEPLLRKALEASRATLGDRHPHTLRSINNLGRLLKDQGKLDEAEPLLREALQATRATLGNRHPGTLAAIHDLGALLKDQGKLDEAKPLMLEALEAMRATLGDQHPHTLAAIHNLESLLKAQGKLDEAEPLLREALEVRRATLGDRHPQTLAAIHNLGSLLATHGKHDEALPLLVEHSRATLGDRHPFTLNFMSMHQARELKRAPLVGEQVLVLGLVAKPELNHRTGTAAGWDSERGRYSVRLQDGSTVTLKPANLRKL